MKKLMPKPTSRPQEQAGFITLILMMLAIVAAVIIFAYLRVAHAAK